jgi:hypothetical protein
MSTAVTKTVRTCCSLFHGIELGWNLVVSRWCSHQRSRPRKVQGGAHHPERRLGMPLSTGGTGPPPHSHLLGRLSRYKKAPMAARDFGYRGKCPT